MQTPSQSGGAQAVDIAKREAFQMLLTVLKCTMLGYIATEHPALRCMCNAILQMSAPGCTMDIQADLRLVSMFVKEHCMHRAEQWDGCNLSHSHITAPLHAFQHPFSNA